MEDAIHLGRKAVVGAAIGFVVVTVGMTIAGALTGLGIAPALGLGLFVGAWGGTAFGFMMGGTVPLGRQLEHGS